MKSTAAEPFEPFMVPVPGGSTVVAPGGDPEPQPEVLGLDARGAMAFVVARRRRQDLEAAEEMRGLCHFADLHRVVPGRELEDGAVDAVLVDSLPDSVPGELGTEGVLRLAGEGCFMVAEFAITELAVELGMGEAAARALVGQSLELRDRLPRLWERVMAGELPAWKGRQIARQTIPLTAEAAAYVDAHLAPFAKGLSLGRILKAVGAAIVHHDPERAAALAEAAAEHRGVWVDHGPDGPADLEVADGTSRVSAVLDTPDAVALEDAVASVATSLGRLGHRGSWDVRRAKALGVLADPQHALDLAAAADGDDAAAGEMRPRVRTPKRLGGTVIHVHLHTAAVDGLTGGGGDRLGPVARVPQLGPRPASVVQQWLADLAPGAKVTVTPVIDLAGRVGVDAHEAPPELRAQIDHLDATCVFPWCGRQGRFDLDHIEEYVDPNEGGPPGQTNSSNLAKLCRYHHRVKTHTGWRYRRGRDLSLTWTSPLGMQYRVDHTGTTRADDPCR